MSSFLGEVHFEELPGKGRVRCVETGHELLAADKESYGRSKKCRRALFDLCLAQRKPPLNVFEQSATFRDKVICKLTGDLLNKSEDALWKHMNGKKFQRKLAQKEDDLQQRAEDAMDISRQVGDGENARAGPDGETIDDSCNTQGDEDRNMDLEELEIWVPPSDDQDSGCCGDVPSPNADQRCEKEGGSDEVFQSMGIKRKARKGPSRPGVLKKKLRQDADRKMLCSSSEATYRTAGLSEGIFELADAGNEDSICISSQNF